MRLSLYGLAMSFRRKSDDGMVKDARRCVFVYLMALKLVLNHGLETSVAVRHCCIRCDCLNPFLNSADRLILKDERSN